MEKLNMWRFAPSNHTKTNWMDNAGTETFEKAPYYSLAREVLQNSIDARVSFNKPVIVEFSFFEIGTEKIPGYKELKNAIEKCKTFWTNRGEVYKRKIDDMLAILDNEKIKCLRISDYNTTGLKDKNFEALVKGNGISEKNDSMAGGSKGVGKNALFLKSSLRTVFYSTTTNEKSFYIGDAELPSGYIDDNIDSNSDYTTGPGLFSSDDLNNGIDGVLNLDPAQKDRRENTGTDIYIIGFDCDEDDKKEIINGVLESYMATLVYNDLVFIFNGREISKNNLNNIIYNNQLILADKKADIVSQYRLLEGIGDVHKFIIETNYDDTVELNVLPFSNGEQIYATKSVAMIRYPYMKIKNTSLLKGYNYSAICIIGKDGKNLGETLRSIENPQHNDWELKRIADKTKRNILKQTLNEITSNIQKNIESIFASDTDEIIDPNGAGDYLPSIDDNGGSALGKNNLEQLKNEKTYISTIKVNETISKKNDVSLEYGNGLEPDIGGIDESKEGDVMYPDGHNEGVKGPDRPGNSTGNSTEGDSVIFKKQKLSGVSYKVISVDKNNGKFKIIFVSPIDNDNCYLNIMLLDDMNTKTSLDILRIKYNGKEILSKDENEFGPFSIKTNQKVVLDVVGSVKGNFGCEVKVICK